MRPRPAVQQGDDALGDQISISDRPAPPRCKVKIVIEVPREWFGRGSPTARVEREMRDVVDETGVEPFDGIASGQQGIGADSLTERVLRAVVPSRASGTGIGGVEAAD